MPLDTTSGTTILVSTSAELKAAYETLSTMDGGGTVLLDGDGGPYVIHLRDYPDDASQVTFTSNDPENLAHVEQIYLREVSNITIDNVYVDSTEVEGRADWIDDLLVHDASNIKITNTTFIHDADGYLADASDVSETLGMIRWSDNVLFSGNTVEGYYHGLTVLESSNIDILSNDISHLQGDGLRLGGVQNVTIADNYIHDFWGTNQVVTHSDLIQFWGSNAYSLTENVTITGNILDAGEGAASQSIFIRNEQFGDAGEVGGYFKNFVITENIIYNGDRVGIRVADVDGVIISNNTILWNPDAEMQFGDADPVSYAPNILLQNTLGGVITDNIANAVYANDGTFIEGNVAINYTSPQSDNYVGKHFVNVLEGGEGDLRDLWILPDSPWNGVVGASLSTFPTASADGGVYAVLTHEIDLADRYELTFDASLSLDADGFVDVQDYDFIWTFSDGTVIEGISADRSFEAAGAHSVTLQIELDGVVVDQILRNFDVDTKDIARFDFESGPVDISDNDPNIVVTGDNSDVAGSTGAGFLIGDGNKLEIGRWTGDIHDMEAFGLALDMKPTGDEQSGTFLHFYKVLTGSVSEDGHVTFTLETDEGTFRLTSADPIFDDGDWHRIGLAYDGSTGQLEMFADGENVASVAASGVTAPHTYYGLIFGNTWKDSIDAVIDNVEMSADPDVAGTLTPPELPQEDTDPDIVIVDPESPEEEPTPTDTDPDAQEPEPDSADPEPDPDPEPEEPQSSDEKVGLAKVFQALFDAITKLNQIVFDGGSGTEEAPASQNSDDVSSTLPEDPLVALMTDDQIEDDTWSDDGENQDDLIGFQI